MLIIHTPNVFVEEIKKEIIKFLWSNKKPKIKYNVLIQSTKDGGLKLVDIGTKVKSLKLIGFKGLSTVFCTVLGHPV